MPILKTGGYIDRSEYHSRVSVFKALLGIAERDGKEQHPAAIEWRKELDDLEAVSNV